MKKLLISMLFFVFALPVLAQTTAVSGNIADSTAQSFNYGTWEAHLIGPQGYTGPFFYNGAQLGPTDTQKSGLLDSSGNISLTVYSNNVVFVSGSSQALTLWQFTVCSAAYPSPCYTTALNITGSTFSVTGTIVPPPIQVPATSTGPWVAYSDSEITGARVGFTYWNIASSASRVCNAPACTWVTAGGGATPASPGASTQFSNASSTALATVSVGGIPLGVDSLSSPTVFNVPLSTAIKGPAPSADIKLFGATPRQGTASSTTATTVANSPNIILSNPIDFKPNEWVVLLAGNPNAVAAPSAPTVTTPAVSGSNSITYTLVGRIDSPGAGIGPGGLTPVSAGTTTTTSPAIFGPVPITITSATASAGSVTVNATGINCTTSTHIHVIGLSGAGATWNGYFLPTTGGTNSCIYSVSGATGTATVTGATVKLTNAAIPTSITRSTAGVFSITTDIAHNYVATASPNQTILILEGSSTADCNGQYLLATASGSSLTTVATGLTPASTETCALVTAQTYVEVREKNVITAPALANGITQYYVYDNNPAATVQPIGETDPGSLIFRDYGPAVTNQFVPPPYVPSTPPVADTNSLFVAQIQSGAGTTTPTLNANVPTTQSTPVLAEHDDGQAILAACNEMSLTGTPGGGTVLVSAPSTYNFGKYVINYPVILPKSCGLSLATRVVANETLTLGIGSPLTAVPAPTYAGTPAQGGNSYAVISGIANPLVETPNGANDGNDINGVNFTAGSSQQRMLYIREQSGSISNSAFQALNECYATDIVYEGQTGGIQQLRHNTFSTGCANVAVTGGYMPEQPAIWIRADVASGATPAQFTSDGANQWNGGGVMVDSRLRSTGGLFQYHFLGINEVQEPTTPFLYALGGNISGDGDWQVGGVTMDSQGEACFGALAATVTNVWLTGCVVSASSGNLVTGNSIAGLTVANPVTTGQIGSTLYNLIDSNGLTTQALNLLSPSSSGAVTFDGNNVNLASLPFAPLASGFVSGHCGQPTSSGGKWTIADAGGACGSGFTAGGDLSGSSSSQEVIGILSHALPSLTTGFLNWTGSAWALSAAGSGTVTTSGSPASTYLASFTAGTVITGIAAATEDSSGNLTALSYKTSGSNGGLSGTEGTGAGLTAGAGIDLLYPDSTNHCLHDNWNNVDVGCGATASNTLTLTNKTFDTAGTGNVFKINGTGITAVSGTGAVCLASGSACGGGAGPNFTTPVTIAPPSGTTTSFINYPENTAGLGQQPLTGIISVTGNTITAVTSKAIQTGQSSVFGLAYASSTDTITSTGPNDSLGNAVTCGTPVPASAAISLVKCWFNNSGSAGVDTITITLSGTVSNAWIAGEIYSGFITTTPTDGADVSATGNSNAPSSARILPPTQTI